MNMSSRMPTASVKNEIMFAVSRTVSPWAIWLLPSSRSCTARPSKLQAEAKEKRVRVELSRKLETARPVLNMSSGMFLAWMALSSSAMASTARSSASLFSQVSRKSFP